MNKLPKRGQARAKQSVHDIWMAETKKTKYPKATECLEKDREELLAFDDLPAEHWVHIRTSNPIESTFSTVRLRIKKTRGCVSRTTLLTMVFRLGLSADVIFLLSFRAPKQLC